MAVTGSLPPCGLAQAHAPRGVDLSPSGEGLVRDEDRRVTRAWCVTRERSLGSRPPGKHDPGNGVWVGLGLLWAVPVFEPAGQGAHDVLAPAAAHGVHRRTLAGIGLGVALVSGEFVKVLSSCVPGQEGPACRTRCCQNFWQP